MAHDASFLDDELSLLDRSKATSFSLEAVITAKSDEAAAKTHDSVKKICSTIISAYEKTKDPYTDHDEKVAAINAVTTLEPQIAWLVEFSRSEADWCHTPEVHKKMDHIAQTIRVQHSSLADDFRNLKRAQDSDTFMSVFDKILSLLDNVTEFLKQGHAAEVCRVLDNGVFAFAEAKNMLEIELPHLLVQQAKNLKDRVGEFERKTMNLIKIQEKQNKGLHERLSNVQFILDGHISNFILRTRDHLVDNSAENKAQRVEAYNEVKACLDEIQKILLKIKAKYNNLFDEGALQINQDLDDLDDSAYDLMKTLAKLHAPATTPELEQARIEHARALPQKVQELLSCTAMSGADADLKRELIGAVKQGRDGGLADYFDAMQTLENVVRKSMASPALLIPLAIDPTPASAVASMDMLEAAKRMCAALKGVNLALDD